MALLRSVALAFAATVTAAAAADYAIVVSTATAADAGWSTVVQALEKRHPGATVVRYEGAVAATKETMRKALPRDICFVAQPTEAGRDFVRDVHLLVRDLDDDPYTDCRWGILTGYDASNALRIATHTEPLVIRKVLSGTPLALDRCEEGIWYSELEAGRIERKARGKEPVSEKGAADSTAAIVDGLNTYGADLFVTSGHATERDWQLGYRYRNGQFRCANGQVYGLDLEKTKHPVQSEHARVYLPVGNCLMGHVDGTNSMAVAYMNSAGVMQMVGYTVPTWFGYAGWGLLDYFVEQPGRYSLAEAFLANQHALDYLLATDPAGNPKRRGLSHDRTVVAFYGDPAWDARMAPGTLNWEQSLVEKDATYTLTVTPKAGAKTFAPVDTNGSERGGRPIVAYLPGRIGPAKVVAGAEWKPVIADDFVLVPLPSTDTEPREFKVVFEAAPAAR